MFVYFDPLYLMMMLPVMIIAFAAQFSVKSRYSKYSKIPNSRGMTGAQMARYILDSNGLYNVNVIAIAGELTDNFNPKTNTVSLSQGVYNSSSVAAIGIAAHECGHAIQHAQGYFPVKLRTAIVPVCNLGGSLSIPLLILGAVLNFPYLIYSGLVLFALVSFFQFVTLPVEFNASRRAMQTIKESNYFYDEDIKGTRAVLSAAAMTYVAAFAQSLIQLLYYVLRFGGRRND